MSRSRLAALVLVFVLTVPAAVALAAPPVSVSVVSDDGRTVVLDVRVGAYDVAPVTIDGRAFAEITLAGEAVELEAGVPNLPHVTRSVVIPDDAEVEAVVLSAHFTDRPLAVAPSKGNLPRTIDPAQVPYRFGPAYRAAGFAPAALATLGEAYVMRDRRGVAVRINPFQYDAASGTLRSYDALRIAVRPAGPARVNLKPERAVRRTPRVFADLYAAHFINERERSAMSAYPQVDEAGEMLVIAYDAWIPNLDPFVAHKQAIGIPTTIVGVATIGNDATSIKNYIANFYQSHDLAFVLLAGDAAQVATNARTVGSESGASDALYAMLAGGDNYPDIVVGRFSAGTAAELDTQVLRAVEYEENQATQQAWFKRGVGIASDQGAGSGDEGQSDHDHIEQIRGWLLGDGYTLVSQVYDPGATAAMLAAAINDGRGIVNYCGHGSATSWGTTGFSNTDVNNLVNKDQLPVIFSVACNNGEFHHYGACFAEAWLRASKDGRPTGAAAMYASSVSQSWAPPMEAEDEFNLRLTDTSRPYHAFGGLAYAGSSSMMAAYGSGGVEMFDTWVIFGDPSLRIVGTTAPPTGLRVTPTDGLSAAGPVGGPFAPAGTSYVLENLGADPLEFTATSGAGWVTASPASGSIPGFGSTTVNVTLHECSANCDLGTEATSIAFTNATTHEGDTTRAVSLAVGLQTALRRDLLNADPGWSRAGEWQFGVPQGKGGGFGANPDPTSGATGTRVFGVNLAGNYSGAVGGPYWLVAGPFDLTGVHGATLRFARWLNTVGPPYGDSMIDVSSDGTAWTRVWSADGNVTDTAWTTQAVGLAGVADGQPAVSIRFGYSLRRPVPSPGSGWNIDDFELRGRLESARIALSVGPAGLSWTALAGASAYDVVHGDAAALAATAGNFTLATTGCLADGLAATTLAYPAAPPPGSASWFLVRGVTVSDRLTYQDLVDSQVGTRDAEINASAAACP